MLRLRHLGQTDTILQMSGLSGVMAPPPQASPRMPSPYSLPLHALRLAGKCALPLILWFSVGELARWALLYVGTEISHGDFRQARLVATVTLMTLIVMASMTIATGMFYSLRGALWEMNARERDGEERETFRSVLNRVAPGFAVIYLSWSLFEEDMRDFLRMDQLHNIDDNFYSVLFSGKEGEEPTLGLGLTDLDWRVSLAAMFFTFGLRVLFARMVESGSGKYSGVAAAFAEFAFMFCGLNAVLTLAKLRGDWASERVVVAGANDTWEHAKENIPGWEAFWSALGDAWPYIVDALILPLTWLAIAVLVFGGAVDDTRRALRGTRLARGVDRLEEAHQVTQRSTDRVIGGFQERWIPVVNAFKVTVKGGLPLFGLMCLLYVGLHLGADVADRLVRTMIGAEVPYIWLVVSYPVSFVKSLLLTSLTYCLLAAAFDIAATRARLRGEDITA